MVTDYSDEPRSWALPEEPPVGTVVTSADDRWRRDAAGWTLLTDRGRDTGTHSSWARLLEVDGPLIEVPPTPAEELAARLADLASQLRAHPDLHPVLVGSGGVLQVIAPTGQEAAALWAWAQLLDQRSMVVKDLQGETYVYVSGRLGAYLVDVWDTVPGFREYLNEQQAKPGFLAATVKTLGDFVHDRELALSGGGR